MENKDIKQRAREMFDERFGELWSGMKIIGGKDQQKEPWVVIDRSGVKYFIDQIIDLAIIEERKRVVEVIENHEIQLEYGNERHRVFAQGYTQARKDFINLITNTK